MFNIISVFIGRTSVVLLFCCYCCLETAGGTAVIHSVAILNTTTVLQCEPGSSGHSVWSFYPNNSTKRRWTLVNGLPNPQLRYTVLFNLSTGQNDLVISSVQLSDAGTYRCLSTDMQQRNETRDNTIDFKLSVIESLQPCSVVREWRPPAYVALDYISCSVKYSGPVLHFRCVPELSAPERVTCNGYSLHRQIVPPAADDVDNVIMCFMYADEAENNELVNYAWNVTYPGISRTARTGAEGTTTPVVTSVTVTSTKLTVSLIATGVLCVICVLLSSQLIVYKTREHRRGDQNNAVNSRQYEDLQMESREPPAHYADLPAAQHSHESVYDALDAHQRKWCRVS